MRVPGEGGDAQGEEACLREKSLDDFYGWGGVNSRPAAREGEKAGAWEGEESESSKTNQKKTLRIKGSPWKETHWRF